MFWFPETCRYAIHMTAYYRNIETGIVQAHPVAGLGAHFNSIEVGEDGKPVDGRPVTKAPKPRAKLGTPRAQVARQAKLLKTTGGNPAVGDSNKQEENH